MAPISNQRIGGSGLQFREQYINQVSLRLAGRRREDDIQATASNLRHFLWHHQAWTKQRCFLGAGFPKSTHVVQMIGNNRYGGAWALKLFGESSTQEHKAVIAPLLG